MTQNAQKVLDLISEMNPVELNGLVKAIEEKFGVSAAAMVVAGGAAAGAADAGAVASDSVNVELTDAGQQKIAVIKVVKEALNLGLKEAKDLVEKAPVVVKENVKQEEADALKAKLEEAGATVSFK
ncbi:MAG: 50S ribosomal protein L7/L12 [Candidatus Absconditabacteria bacterium]|nr:50S ribosomal protein L7/L12 [Candidatus Absconditabacteria bacterium]